MRFALTAGAVRMLEHCSGRPASALLLRYRYLPADEPLRHRDMVMTVANSYDPASRIAEAIISTGARVRSQDLWSGEPWDEILDMSPGAIRLGRLNNGARLLDSHQHSVLGSVVPVRRGS